MSQKIRSLMKWRRSWQPECTYVKITVLPSLLYFPEFLNSLDLSSIYLVYPGTINVTMSPFKDPCRIGCGRLLNSLRCPSCAPVSYTHLDVYKRQAGRPIAYKESVKYLGVRLNRRLCFNAHVTEPLPRHAASEPSDPHFSRVAAAWPCARNLHYIYYFSCLLYTSRCV